MASLDTIKCFYKLMRLSFKGEYERPEIPNHRTVGPVDLPPEIVSEILSYLKIDVIKQIKTRRLSKDCNKEQYKRMVIGIEAIRSQVDQQCDRTQAFFKQYNVTHAMMVQK